MGNRMLVFAVFVIAFLCPPSVASSLTLVTLGDSLTAGTGDTEWIDGHAMGYPERLLSMLKDLDPESTAYNLGRAGWVSHELINGTPWDGTPGQLGEAETIIEGARAAGDLAVACVWIGSNDLFALYEWKCDASSSAECADSDLQDYSSNIDVILQRLNAAGATVFVALLDDQSRRPVLASPAYSDSFPDITPDELCLMSAQVDRYNDAIRAVASRYGAFTVDFFDTTIFENADTLSEDGNHPNAAGYDLIASIWFNAVSTILGGSPLLLPPSPGITINSSGGSLVPSSGSLVALQISLDAGDCAGMDADWWLVMVGPEGLFSFSLVAGGWVPDVAVAYQGPLFDIPKFVGLMDVSLPTVGDYTFYFGVDTSMNGALEVESLSFDGVSITAFE